jgi:SAM-dependent methyltransferase
MITKAFSEDIPFTCPTDPTILDAGCGTGTIGLTLLKRFPKAFLIATDIERKQLLETIRNSRKMKIEKERYLLGVSEISSPSKINLLSGSHLSLNENSFDVVCASAVIGYSRDPEHTTKTLLTLVKNNGYFINVEMNDTIIGRMISRLYGYPLMSLQKMKTTIEEEGYDVDVFSFPTRYFPTNLTRIVFIARKTGRTPAQTGALRSSSLQAGFVEFG